MPSSRATSACDSSWSRIERKKSAVTTTQTTKYAHWGNQSPIPRASQNCETSQTCSTAISSQLASMMSGIPKGRAIWNWRSCIARRIISADVVFDDSHQFRQLIVEEMACVRNRHQLVRTVRWQWSEQLAQRRE